MDVDGYQINGNVIRPEALAGVDPAVLADMAGVPLTTFLDAVARWADGVGFPYGIVVSREAQTITQQRRW